MPSSPINNHTNFAIKDIKFVRVTS